MKLPPLARIDWPRACRIIRTRFPPIDLFEDIADPADWALLIAAESRSNPRLLQDTGRIDLVPPAQRVSGPGASLVMAPFTHVSPDRASRFADGSYGAYYCGDRFEVALFETVWHHERFMRATAESPGWTADFRELTGELHAGLHDLRGKGFAACLDPHSYSAGQDFGRVLRSAGSDGIVYPSVRFPPGQAAALFRPDIPQIPQQGRHLGYHWDGTRVDRFRNHGTGQIFLIGG